jgi:aspartyl-tRNA(Asn)/glutamyl-tRNA(Gln) amidotransferase subunit A
MTTTNDTSLASIEDVALQIAAKEISPVELTDAMLRRIERLNGELNAYITVTPEAALDEARAAEKEIAAGKHRGPLHGVPIAIKDLFATNGVRTTAGSKLLADWVPDDDATVVTKLREAGAVSLGKLGMHECAYGCTSDNAFYGTVHNPWNPDHVPGGSSGGSGAATAAGLAYATLGSDTGGSIRIPAALCGCVGMMPTYGRASLYGTVPLSWSLDHPGPLTRTVRDAAIVLQAISGYDERDPATEHVPVPDWLANIERGPKGLRIGVPRQFFWDNVDPEVAEIVRNALASLEAAGASVRDVDIPSINGYVAGVNAVLFTEASAYHAPNYPSRKSEYSSQVGALLDIGARNPGVAYVQGMRAMQEARRGGADAMLEGIDVLVTPTCALVAPTIADSRKEDPSRQLAALTAPIDFTGQPALSIACGLTSVKLPVGLQIIGRRWDETSVLWAGRAYEQVRGPFPVPPLALNT